MSISKPLVEQSNTGKASYAGTNSIPIDSSEPESAAATATATATASVAAHVRSTLVHARYCLPRLLTVLVLDRGSLHSAQREQCRR